MRDKIYGFTIRCILIHEIERQLVTRAQYDAVLVNGLILVDVG